MDYDKIIFYNIDLAKQIDSIKMSAKKDLVEN